MRVQSATRGRRRRTYRRRCRVPRHSRRTPTPRAHRSQRSRHRPGAGRRAGRSPAASVLKRTRCPRRAERRQRDAAGGRGDELATRRDQPLYDSACTMAPPTRAGREGDADETAGADGVATHADCPSSSAGGTRRREWSASRTSPSARRRPARRPWPAVPRAGALPPAGRRTFPSADAPPMSRRRMRRQRRRTGGARRARSFWRTEDDASDDLAARPRTDARSWPLAAAIVVASISSRGARRARPSAPRRSGRSAAARCRHRDVGDRRLAGRRRAQSSTRRGSRHRRRRRRRAPPAGASARAAQGRLATRCAATTLNVSTPQ